MQLFFLAVHRCHHTWANMGSWDSLLIERWICDQKDASSNPSRSVQRIFFSRVNFVCWLLFGVSSKPLLQQWHTKYPGQSAKSSAGGLHLHTHTPMTQWSWSGLLCHCLDIVWEPIRKQAKMQRINEHSATVISARWATVDWSKLEKKQNWCAQADLHFKNKQKKSTGRKWTIKTFKKKVFTSEAKAIRSMQWACRSDFKLLCNLKKIRYFFFFLIMQNSDRVIITNTNCVAWWITVQLFANPYKFA